MYEAKLPEFQEVPFNPDNDTGFGTITVIINGEEKTVHETNNLIVLFESFLFQRAGKTPGNPQELAYYHALAFEDKIFPSIVSRFVQRHNELFEVLANISYEREKEVQARQNIRESERTSKTPHPDDLAARFPPEKNKQLRDYYLSQVFDAMVPIANEIDPNYNPKNLCR
ncbi:hypothetical protein H0X09_03860 [Candidatus Saccharibacteria bacterium]|nr:hypothetical protein [Candidatus Saccharibacteria bacterium]